MLSYIEELLDQLLGFLMVVIHAVRLSEPKMAPRLVERFMRAFGLEPNAAVLQALGLQN